MSERVTLILATTLGAFAVALGAFGAHALEAMLEARGRADTWDLAVNYQIIHALVLLSIGILMRSIKNSWLNYSSLLILAGIVCFSGSLYVLCLTNIIFPLVLITPLGGVLLMAGWLALLAGVLKSYQKS